MPAKKNRICDKCNKEYPSSIWIDGKRISLLGRRFCLECSPIGSNNVRDLTKYIPGKRVCFKCKEIKDISEFYTAGTRGFKQNIEQNKKQYYQCYCKECSKKLSVIRQKKKKKICIEYLGNKCLGCGATLQTLNINAFSFHHRDPKEKSFEICRQLNLKWITLKNELDKCDLLCLNCHVTKYDGELLDA